MISKIVTVTSKNQITLPAELVRKYKLDKNRRLSIQLKKNAFILKPTPSLEQRLAPLRTEIAKHVKGSLTDQEIQQSVREIAADRGNR